MARSGPRTTWAAGVNTWRTVSANRRSFIADQGAVARTPGPLVAIEALPDGARCRFAELELELVFVGPAMVRVSWGPDQPPVRPVAWRPSAPGAVRVVGNQVGTEALTVVVGDDGSLRYLAAGVQVRVERPPVRRGSGRWLRWARRDGERVMGLGEQAGAPHRLWNTDPVGSWGDPLYCVIPVVLGVHPDCTVLAFFDNAHDGTVSAGEIAFESGMLRHYVTAGTLADVVARYTQLTGLAPMPPRWALGYHQSRWGYRHQADIRAVSDGFAAEGLPLSVVHLDIDYIRGYRVFTVDADRFPDLLGLTDDLALRGTRAVTIVDPGVKVDPDYDVYADGGDFFVKDPSGRPVQGVVWPGPSVFPDFTDPAARAWWGDLYPRLLDLGIAGMWHDMNEPTSFAFTGDRTLPLDSRHAIGTHRDAHNLYAWCMDLAGAEALRRHRPDRRPFVLSRSGWAGVQASAWLWTGDTHSTWEAMRQQIGTMVNLGLSGIGFAGPDIGGFTGDPGPELYVRWLEMAVLMPLCRTHCTTSAPRREPWCFPEPYRSRIGRLVRLRYRLLPYLYSLAYQVSTTGLPMVRPAGWPTSLGTPDCFLLGDGLLVAPVTAPGAAGRRINLPEGEWVPWHPIADRVGEVVSGRVQLDSPVGTPLVLVRRGTVLALDDGVTGSVELDHRPRSLAFHVFADSAGRASGDFYDDAGDGYGPWRTERLIYADGTLSRDAAGDWPGLADVPVVLR